MRTMKNISKKYYRKRAMKEEGVTILSLVITIIVLLILSGITIKLALDDKGIVGQAKNAGQQYQNSSLQEQLTLNQITQAIAATSNGGSSSGGSTGGNSTTGGGSLSDSSDEVEKLKKQIENLQQQVAELEAMRATGDATVNQVIQGATFSNASETGLTGTMKNNGAWTASTTGSENVKIPAGYHNGEGYVSGAGAYNKGVSDADGRVNTNSASYKDGYNNGKSEGSITSIQGVGSANQYITTIPGELYICFGLGNNVNGNIAWSISGATSLWGTGGNSGGQQARVNLVRATSTSMYVTCGNHVSSSVVRLVHK